MERGKELPCSWNRMYASQVGFSVCAVAEFPREAVRYSQKATESPMYVESYGHGPFRTMKRLDGWKRGWMRVTLKRWNEDGAMAWGSRHVFPHMDTAHGNDIAQACVRVKRGR